jgi:O-antigen/teichoic acid export membrane protein
LKFAKVNASRLGRLGASYLRPEVFFSLAWRFSMAISGLVSIYLIGHRLTPAEQGYWYSFDSLAVARTVFELGFSMVLMQVASHEYPNLCWRNGILEGDPESKARISALLHRSLLWYGGVAILTVTMCIPVGEYLFSRAGGGVPWRLPWYGAVAMTCGLVTLTPLGAILEGTGKLASVARMRLVDSLISNTCMWLALTSGKHLFAMTAGLAASFCFQSIWFGSHNRFYIDLWKSFLPSARYFWKEHVWPFQKRIAVSFVSGYFIIQILNPLSFAVVGPVAAGKLGMSLTLAQGIVSLSTAVVKASAPRFGELIQQRRWVDLDRSFRLSLAQSLTLSSLLAITTVIAIIAMNLLNSPMSTRIVGPWAAACIMLGAILSCVNQALAIYLRAHKTEPLMTASITVAVVGLPMYYALLRWFGTNGAVLGFLTMNGLVNGFWTYTIFRRQRRNREATKPEYALS